MNKQLLLSRLKDLIAEGAAVKTTSKISRSGQKLINRESFSRWQMSCLEYLSIFKGKPYLDSFKKDVKSRLSPNVERGLGILRSLNIALVKGYISIEEEKVEKPEVDINSSGEVTNYLLELLKKGQIKDCQHMKVKKDLVNSFYPECDVDLASKQLAFSLGSILIHGGQAEYYWPNCGKDCPIYKKAGKFVESLISTKKAKVEKLKVDNYVDEGRIKELASLPKDKFDSARLVKLCEELNKCYKNNCELAVAAVVRTILNHIPPIFGMGNFEEVANNYSWGKGKLKGKSKREVMSNLEDTARNIADIHLHQEIRETESLPTMTQVDFKNELDILLEEIVRILKSQAKAKKTT